jgi:uncharacterized protein YjiS (DUF1127 family)
MAIVTDGDGVSSRQIPEEDQMSQIDREMERIGRRGYVAFPSLVTLAAPLPGALRTRPGSETWLPHAWSALHAALAAAVDTIATWRERARMRRHLLLLDDRLLRDIGIDRLLAQSEAEKPFWRV